MARRLRSANRATAGRWIVNSSAAARRSALGVISVDPRFQIWIDLMTSLFVFVQSFLRQLLAAFLF